MFLNIRKVNLSSVGGGMAIVDYYSRDEATDKTALDETKVDDMLGYYSRFDDEEVRTGFDSSGDKSASQSKAEFELYNPQEVYQSVISFRQDDADNLGFHEKADFANLAEKYIRECEKQLDIKKGDLIWTGYLHRNTDNPHMHIYFFDKSKVFQPLFTKSQLKSVRSRLANSIMNQHEMFKEKDELRKELVVEVKMLLSEKGIEEHIQSLMFEGLSMREMSKEDKHLVKLLQDCAHEIPRTGRTQMKVLERYHPEAHESVMKVVKTLIERSPSYPLYQEVLDKIEENYVTLYGSKSQANDYQENQIKDLHNHIGNTVIKTVKEHRSDLEFGNTENVGLSKSLFDLSQSCFSLMNQSLGSLTGGLGQSQVNSRQGKRKESDEVEYEV